MTGTGGARTCHFCDVVFAHHGVRYCCGGCYFKEREITAVRDAARSAMQALAGVLDSREHVTGLRSKHIACHTLVLARRVRPKPERVMRAL